MENAFFVFSAWRLIKRWLDSFLHRSFRVRIKVTRNKSFNAAHDVALRWKFRWHFYHFVDVKLFGAVPSSIIALSCLWHHSLGDVCEVKEKYEKKFFVRSNKRFAESLNDFSFEHSTAIVEKASVGAFTSRDRR